MKNYSASGNELIFKPKRNVVGVSVETGKEIKVKQNGKGYWRLEPKGEVLYMKASGDSVEVKGGTGKLEYEGADYISGRAAVLFGYVKERKNGLLIEPLIELAYNQELKGKNDVKYGGAEYESDLSGGSVEGTVGLNMQLGKDVYWHVQGGYEKGGKVEKYGGNIGIRIGMSGKKDKKKEEAFYKEEKVE
jgi:outer membrane autotransporter protein